MRKILKKSGTMNRLPNPALEGYRTAHEQNRDGSYKHFVMPADLVPKKCNESGGSEPIYRGPIVFEPCSDYTRRSSMVVMSSPEGERTISKKMEQIYRCRHHDFDGMTEEETAHKFGIKPTAVRSLLWRVFRIAPQLFPILTPGQARAWHLFYHEGMSHNLIANTMNITKNASEKLVKKAKKKLDYHKVLSQRILVMNPKQLASLEVGNEIVQIF